jgi:hypothetical protein
MKSKQIKLLKKQIAKLDEEDFDLEVWKIATILLLEKIFGKSSSEIKQIKDISGDMSSWTLRDNLGDVKSERSKLLGKQILQTCIDELELSDEPDDLSEGGSDALMELFKNELTGSQYNKLNGIISSNSDKDEKNKQLNDFFKSFDKNIFVQILAQYLAK